MFFRRQSEKIHVLSKVPLFSNLDKHYLDQIGKNAVETSIQKGDLLAREGTKGSDFTFILEGTAWIEKSGKIVNTISEGDFFGEISLIDGKPRTASVIAETDMTVLVVDAKSFNQLLDTVPGFQKNILVSLCNYVREAGVCENQ
jgi:CRP/FNR family cyclic AMP-dependent transcriptional regulator